MPESVLVAIISSVTTLLVTISSYVLKKRADKKAEHSTQSIEKRIRRDNMIRKIINDVRDKFDFDRVCVFMFHNGTTYYTGESMQKITAVFEVDKDGVCPAASSMQGLPCGILNRPLNALLNEDVFIADVATEKDTHFKNFIESYGVKRQYSFKLEDGTGWIGVLTASYHTSKKQLSAQCIEFTRTQAARISSLMKLTNKHYRLKNKDYGEPPNGTN